MKNIFKANGTTTKCSNMTNFKFGIEIPKTPHRAYILDKVNNDNAWKNTINSEVNSIDKHQTFIILENNEKIPE